MSLHSQAAAGRRRAASPMPVDPWLLGAIMLLMGLGLVMVGSASMEIAERAFGQPWHYVIRQSLFLMLGLAAAFVVLQSRLVYWERGGPLLLLFGLALLLLVLLPGVGKEVNGSVRWIPLGIINLQVSELVKLFVIVYLAGYLVRRGDEVRSSAKGFLKPMALLVVVAGLLLLEPDFGASVVIMITALGMMFLGGARLWQFAMLFMMVLLAFALLALSTPERLERLTTFLNPWADPFASGFQLTQALIAIGRGEWWGVGLGNGVQKLFYLPEAHTDFLFAVTAEELGLAGSVVVIGLFATVVLRAFVIAHRAERCHAMFAAYLAYGLGLWIGFQAFINIGVNMGVLPTKGLTLPLMSYGGSSAVVTCVAMALLLRVDYEVRQLHHRQPGRRQELRS